ncbi:MAG: Hsp33 family molecular chaperone HslO [Gammaproteobacteria bacterium]
MNEHDKLRRFLFEECGIRGEWIKLKRSWQAAREHQSGPAHALSLLGEALAAVTLLSATIKFKGSMILQAQGKGAFGTLVAQADEQRNIRGLVRCRDDIPVAPLADLFEQGYMALTVKSEKGEPYQGIVPLTGARLADALAAYFEQSEQLHTRIWLCANDDTAAGLLLQVLPGGQDSDGENWERIGLLAATLTETELLSLDCETLLHRLFNQEKVRVFDAETVNFRCHCSQEKIDTTLKSMGRSELESLLAEQGEIRVDCEFCGRIYRYDRIDMERLLSEHSLSGTSITRH